MSTADQCSTPQQPCTATRVNGEGCKAFALPGRPTCAVHAPERAQALHEARSRGGKVRALRKRRRRLDNAAALVRFTSGLIHDVLDGEKEPDVIRAALYGISLQRQLLEASSLEERLAALEAAVVGQAVSPRRIA